MSEHRYETQSGYATFWNHIVDAIKFNDDHLEMPKHHNAHIDPKYKNKVPIKRCICSNVSPNLFIL
jgi:hypothetical protein